jgi:hypothetical protein
MMPATRFGSTTTSTNLLIHTGASSLPGELEAAAGLLISMRRDSSIVRAKSAAPSKRQREVRSPEIRPSSRQRISIDLTAEPAAPSTNEFRPAPAESLQPARLFSAYVVKHTPVMSTSDTARSSTPAIPIDLKHHIQTRGAHAAITEGKFRGWSVLHVAAYTGDLEILKLLHDKKQAIVNGRVAHDACLLPGATTLEAAIWGKQAKAVEYLASIGADVSTVRTEGVHSGLSPLHLAALAGNLASVRVLLDTLVTNPHETALHAGLTGQTAVTIAKALEYNDIVDAFTAYDAYMETHAIFKRGASLLARYAGTLS